MKTLKTGSVLLIALGLLHLLAHFFGKPNDPHLEELLLDMQNFKVNLMGEHTLLKFHEGFSIMMGFLLSAFGLLVFFMAKEILANRTAFVNIILIALIAFGLSVIYFHIVAYGMLLATLVCFVFSFVRSKTN